MDAINSTAYCVKFMAAASPDTLPENLFQNLQALYQQALAIDSTDIEANFNLGLLYLQFNQDLALALDCFKTCVARDDESEEATLYKVQFAKSYYNIGMIYDKLGHVQMASESYLMAMTTCRNDPQGQLTKSATYKKAGTNYAVTLEKLDQRDTAVGTLSALKDTFGNEVRVYNNLGIIQKRNGDSEGALESYEKALKVDRASFFPNYNLGVLLSQEKMQPAESLIYFNRALDQAHKAQEQLYEINVLINIALIHEGQESYPAAIEHMEKALKIDPENTKIQTKLKQLQAGGSARVS